MNLADLIISIVLALALLRGYTRGLLGVAAAWVAPVLGIVAAIEWSAPLRDRLAVMIPEPELAADVLAPFFAFVGVVMVIKAAAALAAKSLGVGLSTGSRVAAAALSITVSGFLLGCFDVLVDELKPRPRAYFFEDEAEAETVRDALTRPLEDLIGTVDGYLEEAMLAPPLGRFAGTVLSTALARDRDEPLIDPDQLEEAARKAANAAVDAVGKAAQDGRAGRADRNAGDGPR